ncbi:MAG: cell division protein FtsZ [Selenomonadaceae bacterium]|nr:cell division protein FtsZ [Selenomonadaceae bacterium]
MAEVISINQISKLKVNAEKQGQSAATPPAIARAVVKIKIFGIGGGGCSAIERLVESDFTDVEMIAVNTDSRALSIFNGTAVHCLQIGATLTKNKGAGGKIDIGELAAKSDAERLKDLMKGADMIFITATMGGGTGTGAAPVVAAIAKQLGILTVGVVTYPFGFEGNRKQRIANEGIAKMQANMDALVVVKNDNLMKLPENRSLTVVDAFNAADTVLQQAIRCIAELILTTGFINVDFADVKTIFQQSTSSDAILGIGRSNISAVKAVQQALESPLIDRSLKDSRGMILNITADENLTLYEVSEATDYIVSQTEGDVNIIFGVVIDKKMNGIIQAMLIATDFADSLAFKAPENSIPRARVIPDNRNIISPFNFPHK